MVHIRIQKRRTTAIPNNSRVKKRPFNIYYPHFCSFWCLLYHNQISQITWLQFMAQTNKSVGVFRCAVPILLSSFFGGMYISIRNSWMVELTFNRKGDGGNWYVRIILQFPPYGTSPKIPPHLRKHEVGLDRILKKQSA